MSITNFNELLKHKGHSFEVVTYGNNNIIENVALECIDCDCVIMDFDREEEQIERQIDLGDKLIAVEKISTKEDLYSIFIIDKVNQTTDLYADNLVAADVENVLRELINPFQRMFGVEYETSDGETTTYDIFDNLPEAINFTKGKNWLYVFESDMKNIYQEEDGTWNYDDEIDTLNNTQIIYENKEFIRGKNNE